MFRSIIRTVKSFPNAPNGIKAMVVFKQTGDDAYSHAMDFTMDPKSDGFALYDLQRVMAGESSNLHVIELTKEAANSLDSDAE